MKKLTFFILAFFLAMGGFSTSVVGKTMESMPQQGNAFDVVGSSEQNEPTVSNIHIKKLWEFSTRNGNKPEEKDIRNGFAYYDGELFLASRRHADTEVVIYDAVTGEPKMSGGKIEQLSANSSLSMTYASGDVAIDRNGAIYVVASNNANIYKWESRDATASTIFATLPGGKTDAGFFGFDVYIDENGDGCIVGISQISWKLCYIPIINNVAGTAKEMWLWDDVEPGTAPRASIVDAKTFWIDGASMYPTLVELNDNLGIKTQRSFNPESISQGVSGVAQFDYKDKTYLVVAANNHGTTHSAPQHSAALYEFNPVDMSYKQLGDYLPKDGLGGTTDYSHMVAPVVHVAEDGAYIYLMGGMDGLAAFKLYDSSEPIEPEFSYAKKALTKYLADAPFTNPLTSETDGAITYESSEEQVATVDSDGEVTIVGTGTTIIKATAAATDVYLEATATYTLTVESTPSGPILENLWEYSVKKGNMGEVFDFRNGFDYYEGELLFASRRHADTEVVFYDAETGKAKMSNGKPVQLPASPDISMTFAGGDVVVDDNGAIYVITSSSEKIIKWNSRDDTSPSVFATLPAKDIWALDVQIDTDGNGCIVTASQATGRVYYLPVTNNTPGEVVTIKTEKDLGYTPRTHIVDAKTFWVDGNANLPIRVTLNDDYTIKSQHLLAASGISQGANGIAEFKLKGKTYIVMAANNHAPNEIPNHSAMIFELNTTTMAITKVSDYFPEIGLGGDTDASHVVAPVVNVVDDAAYIYIMGGMNGIAAYKFMVYGSDGPVDPQFTYAQVAVTKTVGDEPFINPLTSNTDGVITFTSSNPSVATVDNDGKVVVLAEGNTTITASATATGNYNAATATYVLTVEPGSGIDGHVAKAQLSATPEGVHIEFAGEALIEIYNINGSLVEKAIAFDQYNTVLTQGIYVIRVNGVNYKFVK